MSPKDDFSPQKPRRPQRACAGGRGGASAILSRRSQWIRAIPPGSALPTASAARSAGSWMRGAASAASASGGTWSAGAASRSSSASPSIPSSPSSSSTGPCWAPPSLGMGDGKVQPRSFPFFPPQVQLPRLRLEPRRTGAGPRPRRSSAAPRGAVPRPRAGVRLRAQREATGAGQRHPSRVGVRGRAQLLLGGARGGAGSCSSPRASRDGDRGEGPREVSGGTREYPRVRPELKVHLGPIYPIPCSLRSYSELIPEEKVEQGPEPQEEEEEEEEEEDFAEDDDLTYTDDLRDENYHPSLDSEAEPQRRPRQSKAPKDPIKEEQPPDELSLSSSSPSEERGGRVSCKRRTRASDEDVAQIGPKRIRKAAKREILLCDFEGCGKIFSNRQYLNHHKKYQHVHQKTFTCSEPSCGKSFNFKKHLKEHEKLHSDKRDYICEFCARSFRTSSNLIIHRRIHTGEKPLQCEVCGFTCRQKASLNWHMRKHGAAAAYRFSCELCGKRFEKRDNVAAHKSKSHPPPAPAPPAGPGGGGEMEGIGMRDAGASPGAGMEAVGS
ncbi:uncharacterized protein AAGF69_015178 isoform 2-T2 [Amazona ochrocephala]